jgi:hypothetical protein
VRIVKGYLVVFKVLKISIVRPSLICFQNIDTLVQPINFLKNKMKHELVSNYFVKPKYGKYHNLWYPSNTSNYSSHTSRSIENNNGIIMEALREKKRQGEI